MILTINLLYKWLPKDHNSIVSATCKWRLTNFLSDLHSFFSSLQRLIYGYWSWTKRSKTAAVTLILYQSTCFYLIFLMFLFCKIVEKRLYSVRVPDRESVRHAPNYSQKSIFNFLKNFNINKDYKNKSLYVCLHLHNSIKTWDSVDLRSLSDKLALYFIPHGMNGVGVWANEHHSFCCLITKQS